MKTLSFLIVMLICGSIHAQVTFQKTFGTSQSEYGYSVKQARDGGYIIGGYGYSINLTKLDSLGSLQWSKSFGSQSWCFSIASTLDTGCIMVGKVSGGGAGAYEVYVLKLDKNGAILWSNLYGGLSNDEGHCIIQTADSGYVIAGMTQSFGAGGSDIFVLKLNEVGVVEWSKAYGGVDGEWSQTIQQTSDGGYVLGASTGVIKLDEQGNIEWAKTNIYDCRSVAETYDGGYVVAMNSFSILPPLIIKMDNAGTFTWAKSFIEGDYIEVRETSNHDLIIAGGYLIKTDENGGVIWIKNYSGYFMSVQETIDGGYIAGGNTNLFGGGNDDFHFLKTDNSGNVGCFQTTVTETPFSEIIQLNNYAPTMTVANITTTSVTIFEGGNLSEYILCENIPVNLAQNTFEPDIEIYPNPSQGIFTFTLPVSTQQNYELDVLNAYGQSVYQSSGQALGETKNILTLAHVASGLYSLQVKLGEEMIYKKIVITH